eukprot:g11612.t1
MSSSRAAAPAVNVCIMPKVRSAQPGDKATDAAPPRTGRASPAPARPPAARQAPRTGAAPQAGKFLPAGLKKLLPDRTDPAAAARSLRAQNVSPYQSFADLVEVEDPGPILKALADAGTLDVALAQGLLLTPDGTLYRKGTVWRSDVRPDATRSVGERMLGAWPASTPGCSRAMAS